ncbi:helix-turn-helix domain-containing protein [Moellerella wisconsensis]|uniref:Helix-turn-helix domain-containing protein n=1 Tax=Moellerella wisconsensis TaxID=158849 RepID=A0A9Q8Q059_9GAMM|nr:helix-turn-helix transcriptional regulator [Moellerella wisconsensis]UNH30030.1 helix-turn-helix domain-containing protein [Moellerella wisconsensis]
MNKKVSRAVGKKIRCLRESYNMNGCEFAALLGISQQHQSRYENGENNIHADTIYILSSILNVDLDYFFSELSTEIDDFDEEDIDYKKNHFLAETVLVKD